MELTSIEYTIIIKGGLEMPWYIEKVIVSLEEKLNTYEKNSDAYKELENVIAILKHGLQLQAKLVREL